MNLTIEESGFDGWFCIYGEGLQPWRAGGANVEGPAEDMTGLAEAIENRGRFSERRCAVVYVEANDTFELWSPRNSMSRETVTALQARVLAANIRTVLAAYVPKKPEDPADFTLDDE